MNHRPLVICTDAGPEIGTGHLMRMLALAEAWRAAGGWAVFVSHCSIPPLRARIEQAGFPLVFCAERWSEDSMALATTVGRELDAEPECPPGLPPWVALDGYRFPPDAPAALAALGCRVLLMDDMGPASAPAEGKRGQSPSARLAPGGARLRAVPAKGDSPLFPAPDLLLNQNYAAELLDCPHATRPHLLLGTTYALLRPEFSAWRDWQRSTPAVARKILITCGGSDPKRATLLVLRGLERLDTALDIKAVVGAGCRHTDELRAYVAARKSARHRVEILENPADMPALMAWADLAVAAAGSVAWELALLQLPAVLIVTAENQDRLARQLDRAGVAENLGPVEGLDPAAVAAAVGALCRDADRRAHAAVMGRRLVDGRGADRVAAIMRALDEPLPPAALVLRPAVQEDVFALWRQSSEPSVLSTSLCPEDCTLDEFDAWLRQKLARPTSRLWVLEFHGLVAAQVRYDRKEPHLAEVSFSVAAPLRRRGLAVRLLRATFAPACRELGVDRLRAVVRQENAASAATCRKAGFRQVDSRTVEGFSCYIFERDAAAGSRV